MRMIGNRPMEQFDLNSELLVGAQGAFSTTPLSECIDTIGSYLWIRYGSEGKN